ncbi:MAG: hypothetical protein JWO03_1164 [Bacteroidetes bacterium]|nr:hypothetical protein [Bacteroidota bacterium]
MTKLKKDLSIPHSAASITPLNIQFTQHDYIASANNPTMRYPLLLLLLITYSLAAQTTNVELRRYKAPQAKQGVVANKKYFIVFSNDSMVKYDKGTGQVVQAFYSDKLKHLNSGIIRGGNIYCAHSNYPAIPMWSSIEIWDEKTLQHTGSHSFGIESGSCTWMDIHKGYYYVMFAHYANPGKMEPGKDVSWSQLVKYDMNWRRVGAWVLPPALVQKLTPYSLSGGVITAKGEILCSPHHNKELYLLSFPDMGSELIWKSTIQTPIDGQAIALDTDEKDVLWGISRETREVIKTKLVWK